MPQNLGGIGHVAIGKIGENNKMIEKIINNDRASIARDPPRIEPDASRQVKEPGKNISDTDKKLSSNSSQLEAIPLTRNNRIRRLISVFSANVDHLLASEELVQNFTINYLLTLEREKHKDAQSLKTKLADITNHEIEAIPMAFLDYQTGRFITVPLLGGEIREGYKIVDPSDGRVYKGNNKKGAVTAFLNENKYPFGLIKYRDFDGSVKQKQNKDPSTSLSGKVDKVMNAWQIASLGASLVPDITLTKLFSITGILPIIYNCLRSIQRIFDKIIHQNLSIKDLQTRLDIANLVSFGSNIGLTVSTVQRGASVGLNNIQMTFLAGKIGADGIRLGTYLPLFHDQLHDSIHDPSLNTSEKRKKIFRTLLSGFVTVGITALTARRNVGIFYNELHNRVKGNTVVPPVPSPAPPPHSDSPPIDLIINRVDWELAQRDPSPSALGIGALILMKTGQNDEMAKKALDRLAQMGKVGYFQPRFNPSLEGAYALRALVIGYEKYGNIEYKNAAIQTGRYMTNFFTPVASVAPVMSVSPAQTFLPDSLNTMAQAAMALHYYQRLEPSSRANMIEKTLVKNIMRLQNYDGSFPDGGPIVPTYPHGGDYRSSTVPRSDTGYNYNGYRVGSSDQYNGMIYSALKDNPYADKAKLNTLRDYFYQRYSQNDGTLFQGAWAHAVVGNSQLSRDPDSIVNFLRWL